MRRSRNHLTIAAVAFLLGVLVIAQIRSQGVNAGLANQTAQDLTLLVANLNTQNEELRGTLATLEQQLATLADSRSKGQSAAGQLRSDLDRIQAWAGLRAVAGSGISVQVSGSIDGQGVEDFLNELHNAGAEAVSVGGVRVVPGSVVAGPIGALSIQNTPLGPSFEIRAIGSPQILTGSLTRSGGIIAQLSVAFPTVAFSVTPLDTVTIPATLANLVPAHGQPSL